MTSSRFDRFTATAAVCACGAVAAEHAGRGGGLLPWMALVQTACFAWLLADALWRRSPWLRNARAWRRYPLDPLLLLYPWLLIGGQGYGGWGTAVRLLLLGYAAVSRWPRSDPLAALLHGRPTRMAATGFAGAIAFGTILLRHPDAASAALPMPWVDALFTATSATCVTGLVVHDTATYLSRFGQSVVLVLLQAGGLGVMTLSISLLALPRRRMGIRRAALAQEMLEARTRVDVRRLVRFVLLMTFAAEAAGACLLFAAWAPRFDSVGETLRHAVFQSVSAFCNAGFSTFSDSLVRFRTDRATNLVMAALVVTGGLGFPVVRDLLRRVRPARRSGPRRFRAPLGAQSRAVLSVSGFLLAAGTLLVLVLERRGALAGMGAEARCWSAFFQSVTARTAGFHTLGIASLAPATLWVLMALMFVGASPGSTGGGIKTTTVSVLGSVVRAGLRGRQDAEIGRRTVPPWRSAGPSRCCACRCSA